MEKMKKGFRQSRKKFQIRQILKELIWNLHYTDEDQKSETIVYSYQVMEKKIIWFEKQNPSTYNTV